MNNDVMFECCFWVSKHVHVDLQNNELSARVFSLGFLRAEKYNVKAFGLTQNSTVSRIFLGGSIFFSVGPPAIESPILI